jgi:hypothetical protein
LGFGGLFGELTAGVLASRFAGGRAVCAITGMVEATGLTDFLYQTH